MPITGRFKWFGHSKVSRVQDLFTEKIYDRESLAVSEIDMIQTPMIRFSNIERRRSRRRGDVEKDLRCV